MDQFNAVSLRVISSILTCTESKSSGPNMRGKYIARWINVAQVALVSNIKIVLGTQKGIDPSYPESVVK